MHESISSRLAGAILGFLGLVLTMMVTGAALTAVYRPQRDFVESTFRPAVEGGVWKYIAAFHYWGSACLILAGTALLIWLFLSGFQSKSKNLWLPTLATTGLCFLLQVLGNALPMDRHDVQTINVEASIAGRTPLAGEAAQRFLLGGTEFSESTVGHWYRLTIVAVVLLALSSIWLWSAWRKSGAAKLDLTDRGIGAIFVLVPIALSFVLPRATGELYTSADIVSQAASPSWYVLPMHALLHLFDRISPSIGWLGTVGVPGLLSVVAASATVWARNLSSLARSRLVLGAMAATGLLVGFSGSSPAPIAGNQPVHEIVDTGRGGPIDMKLAQAGLVTFDKHCAGCHGKSGIGGSGGPKVDKVHEKTTDPQWYMDFIRNPSSKKPGSTMPAFSNLPESELKALAEWLRSAK